MAAGDKSDVGHTKQPEIDAEPSRPLVLSADTESGSGVELCSNYPAGEFGPPWIAGIISTGHGL